MISNLSGIAGDDLTAVIACPSVGNVGQLACDLLITNSDVEHVGSTWHPGLLPLVGGDPYRQSSDKICTSNDFYQTRTRKFLFAQLRAPVLMSESADFSRQLVDLLRTYNVKKIVVLSGMFGHQRDDEAIRAGLFRFVLNGQAEPDASTLSSLGWVRLEGNSAENPACPKIRGTGFTRALFNVCAEKSVPFVALVYACSEGDNLQDSLLFTSRVNQWLDVIDNPQQIKKPISWKYLFGNECPKSMY